MYKKDELRTPSTKTAGHFYEYCYDVLNIFGEISFQKHLILQRVYGWKLSRYIYQTHSAWHVLHTSFEDIKTKEKKCGSQL